MVVATQCLQVVQRVVITCNDVVHICCYFSAPSTSVDPDPLAAIPSALENGNADAFPVSRQSLTAIACTPHISLHMNGGLGVLHGDPLSYAGSLYGGWYFPTRPSLGGHRKTRSTAPGLPQGTVLRHIVLQVPVRALSGVATGMTKMMI